jgi:alkylhydroperoxidase family enzyme
MPAASTDLRAAGPWAAMAAKVFGTRSGQIYAQIKKAIGSRLLSDSRFGTERRDTLSKHDQEVITPVISGAAECDYCVAAHTDLVSSPA